MGLAATRDSLGYAHLHLGHHRDAVVCYQNAVDLYRNLGVRCQEALAHAYLGDTHHATATVDAARRAWP